jgi:hypothetical protein
MSGKIGFAASDWKKQVELHIRCLIAGALCLALSGRAAVALPCAPEPGRVALPLAGEVAAGEAFSALAGPGRTFMLEPDAHGWVIRIRAPDGDDIARITPPFHFVPNPRDLHGWHFRNRANTGPNQGDVNAPQHVRDFIFDREIRPDWSDATRVAAAEGRGSLEIVDFALAPPEPGVRAHFTRLTFEACLTWPAAWDAR